MKNAVDMPANQYNSCLDLIVDHNVESRSDLSQVCCTEDEDISIHRVCVCMCVCVDIYMYLNHKASCSFLFPIL